MSDHGSPFYDFQGLVCEMRPWITDSYKVIVWLDLSYPRLPKLENVSGFITPLVDR